MISVDEAVQRIVAAFRPLETEYVAIENAAGRVLAQDAVAQESQPPFAVSAMDGYAVRAADAREKATLQVIGSSPAGHPFAGCVEPGQAVRIFTGAVVPNGADAVVIQENAIADADKVTICATARSGQHIRPAGLDFQKGDVLAEAGRRLSFRDVSLLAAGDISGVSVRRKPRVAFLATGDELSRPGEPRKRGGIVASSGYGLAAMIANRGGIAQDLGILPDTTDAIAQIPVLANNADLIVTLGGASVGDHDLVQQALGPKGFELDFWKIAMRPGKPLLFGRLGKTPLLGLPGNPVSSLVCALLFLKPAIAAMLGQEHRPDPIAARLARDLPANDSRQDYLRAALELRDGEWWAVPFALQDSSMLSVMARADGLILRLPGAPAATAGERVDVLRLE